VRIHAHGQRRSLGAGSGERGGFVRLVQLEPPRRDPRRQALRVHEMPERIALERGYRLAGVPLGESAQHRIHEARDALGARRARAAHRLVDRGARRHAIVEQDLIGTEPQRGGSDALEAIERAVEEAAEQVVDLAAPAQRAVHELGRECAVDRTEPTARELAVQQDVGVGARALHALEHAQREQPSARGRVRVQVGAGTPRRSAPRARRTAGGLQRHSSSVGCRAGGASAASGSRRCDRCHGGLRPPYADVPSASPSEIGRPRR
jgi:hypothetical protein